MRRTEPRSTTRSGRSTDRGPFDPGHTIYEGRLDADFGLRTFRAVVAFQRQTFGPGNQDGIVGAQTATALGVMSWPQV